MDHFNKLSPGTLECLALLSEECAEVCVIIGKIIRHGYYYPDTEECNATSIERELGHVLAAIELLSKRDVDLEGIENYKEAKIRNVKKYLHHN